MNEVKQRLAPFLVLLEARYLPLLFAASPQAYTVYRWLWSHSDASTEAWVFSVMGGLGYEFVYVGAIAWAEEGRFNRWTWATAISALIFSIAVAIYVHMAEGWAAVLHAGFPLVAFCYTMAFHGHRPASTLAPVAQETISDVQEVVIEAPAAQPALASLVADLQYDEVTMQEELQKPASTPTLAEMLAYFKRPEAEVVANLKKYGLWNAPPERAYAMVKQYMGLPAGVDEQIFATLFSELKERDTNPQKPAGISEDAWQAWRLVARGGKTQSEVAGEMQKSISTISRYCKAVEKALQA